MKARRLACAIFSIVLLAVGGHICAAEKDKTKYVSVSYDNACFIVNQSFCIDLRNRPEDVIGDYEYVKNEWLNSRYYTLTDFPIRLASIGDRLYSVQFLFSDDLRKELTLRIYDLQVTKDTTLDDLELYFQSHQIEYSRGINNIATPFVCFYFEGGRLGMCEFRVAVLRHYGDYFFMKVGERPWWAEK